MEKDPVFEEWIKTRPEVIQELAKKYPPGRYIIKEGAPYSITCSGSVVELFSYYEDGNVTVVLYPEDKRPEAIIHEAILGILHNRVTPIAPIRAEVDPKWLLPIIEIEQ